MGTGKKISVEQIILGLVVVGLSIFLLTGIYTGKRDIRQVENMPKASEERLDEIQKEIRKQQEEGIAYSDPFITDRLELDNITYIGRLTIPKINVDESIVVGTSPETLKVGVGVLEGSDLPLGNKGESTIIAGHRGYLFRSNFFKDLEDVNVGDKVIIELDNETLTYEVFSTREVKVDDVSSVHIDEEKTYIALVTSPKFWLTDDRLLVEAELVTE